MKRLSAIAFFAAALPSNRGLTRCRGKSTRPVLYCDCAAATLRWGASTFRGNDMNRAIRVVLAGAIIAASCAAATAQTLRVRGTIEKADGNVLTLKSTDGAELKLTLTDNALIVAVVKASMADIKEGTFLGSAAMPQPDGSQKALEVHIFPEQMRGTGEGHRPYAPVPNSTMTNGSASGAVAGVDGPAIVVKYKDGEKKVLVPPGIPIAKYAPGSAADFKVGAKVFVAAAKKEADGTLTAPNIAVGRSIDPPQ